MASLTGPSDRVCVGSELHFSLSIPLVEAYTPVVQRRRLMGVASLPSVGKVKTEALTPKKKGGLSAAPLTQTGVSAPRYFAKTSSTFTIRMFSGLMFSL